MMNIRALKRLPYAGRYRAAGSVFEAKESDAHILVKLRCAAYVEAVAPVVEKDPEPVAQPVVEPERPVVEKAVRAPRSKKETGATKKRTYRTRAMKAED